MNTILFLLLIILIIIIVILLGISFDYNISKHFIQKNNKIGGLKGTSILDDNEIKNDVNIYDYENLYRTALNLLGDYRRKDINNILSLCLNCPVCKIVQSDEKNLFGYNYTTPNDRNIYIDIMLSAYYPNKYNIFTYKTIDACSDNLLGYNNNFILKKYPFPLQNMQEWGIHFNQSNSLENDLCLLYGLNNFMYNFNKNYILVNIIDIYYSSISELNSNNSEIYIGVDIYYITEKITYQNLYDFDSYQTDNIINSDILSELININKRHPFIKILLKNVPIVLFKLATFIKKIYNCEPIILRNIIMMAKLISLNHFSLTMKTKFNNINHYPEDTISLSSLYDATHTTSTFDVLNIDILSNIIPSDNVSINDNFYNTIDQNLFVNPIKSSDIHLNIVIPNWKNMVNNYINELEKHIQIKTQYLQCIANESKKVSEFIDISRRIGIHYNWFPKELHERLKLCHFLVGFDDYLLLCLFSEFKQKNIRVNIISNDKFKDWFMYFLPKNQKEKQNVINDKYLYKNFVQNKLIDQNNNLSEYSLPGNINYKFIATTEFKKYYNSIDENDSKIINYLQKYIMIISKNPSLEMQVNIPLPQNTEYNLTLGIDKFTVESFVQKINSYKINKKIINRDLEYYSAFISSEIVNTGNKQNFSLIN